MEDGHTIELLSIGLVCEDGREFYLENAEADFSKANDWVKANVLPHLKAGDPNWPGVSVSRTALADHLMRFCDSTQYGKPEFWAYYADYDWVAICQLFGRMLDLPSTWPKYCLDIKQECVRQGNPRLPKDPAAEHWALADARWNKTAWEFLQGS